MPDQTQSLANHTRFDPIFHFVLGPIFLINFILAIVLAVREWPVHPGLHLWWIVLSFAFLLLCSNQRRYALHNQDRIIRLEERLRIAALLPTSEAAAAQSLTNKQLVALRFASDAELPALVHRAIFDSLSPADVKKSITAWRPDLNRI